MATESIDRYGPNRFTAANANEAVECTITQGQAAKLTVTFEGVSGRIGLGADAATESNPIDSDKYQEVPANTPFDFFVGVQTDNQIVWVEPSAPATPVVIWVEPKGA